MNYEKLVSLENIFQSWEDFKKGKRKTKDVMGFEYKLEDNLFKLHHLLANKTYKHGNYKSFFVQDPKQRHIHKAQVRDRVVHRLLYNYLNKLFDKSFIFDSYSSRKSKGTHKGVVRLQKFVLKVSENYTQDCWSLKCDVKKFFENIDHTILINLLKEKNSDREILILLEEVIESFHSRAGRGKGVPLGNLTSQIFANIYLHKFDWFVKHKLGIKYYLRYADDFLVLDISPKKLHQHVAVFDDYLRSSLGLELHPNKIVFKSLNLGIDFLGYVIFPYHILPRTKTKKRALKKIRQKVNLKNFENSLQSYLGYFVHADTYQLRNKIKDEVWMLKKS